MSKITQFYLFLEKKGLIQFSKFALVGVISAIFEISILNFLLYRYGETYILTFNAVAYTFAVVFNYILSRTFVFETGRYNTKTEFLAFCAVATVGLGINQGVFYLCLTYLAVPAFLAVVLSLPNFAKLIAITITVFWNFTMKKLVVFKG